MARNNKKINFPTNVVNPITYATYMQLIDSQPGHKVDASYASNTLFPTLKNGKDGKGKKDTHTIGVLIDYGLAKYVDKKTVALTHFGKRFLEVFNTSTEEDAVRVDRKEDVDINYNALMLEILINWRERVGEKLFYPGALIIRLLMDDRLEYKFNAYEWEFICENEEFIETGNYEKLISDVIEFRQSGREINLKKANDFCNSLANSWALLVKDAEKFYLLRDLTKENIKDWRGNNKELVYVEDVEPGDVSFDIYDTDDTDIEDEVREPEDEGYSADAEDHLAGEKVNCLEIRRKRRENKRYPLNFIIYGAPGTGKTYSTVEYALAIIEDHDVDTSPKSYEERKAVMATYNDYIRKGQIVFTTFHQSYGYEEFIQGLRPDTKSDKMAFVTVDGVFKRIADKALSDDQNDYVIIIDEINRANISKVFGELITLIENDKRWGEVNETCASLQSGDVFAVPNNLYIVGTMNSADKSISLIDAALRRRFEFIEQYPDASLVEDSTLSAVLVKINKNLADSLESSDLLIGHSYFMGKTEDDLCEILNNNIIPLLYEYFYDNKKKVMGVLNEALEGLGVKPVDKKISRVRVEKVDVQE